MNMRMMLTVLIVVVFTRMALCSTEDGRLARQRRGDTSAECCLTLLGCYNTCMLDHISSDCWEHCKSENTIQCSLDFSLYYCNSFQSCYQICIRTKHESHCFRGCKYEAMGDCLETGVVECCPGFMMCYNNCEHSHAYCMTHCTKGSC
nr:conotoxin precursor con-ikot-ikot [Conus judaeus]